MKTIILLACVIACIIALKGPEPPLWPETFSQDFVIGEKKLKIYESGKTWIDYKAEKQRWDYSGSHFQGRCSLLDEDKNASCSLLSVNGGLYVSLPQKSKCCTCCLPGDDCVPVRQDWLKYYDYAGEVSLSGQAFYKWTIGSQSYLATEDAQRIPRRVETENITWDFIMNTFTTDPINDSIFKIPSNCNSLCPRGGNCRTSTEKPNITSLRQALFGNFF